MSQSRRAQEAKTLCLDGLKTILRLTPSEGLDIDMVETLSALFQKSKGAPIEFNGNIAQPIFQFKIEANRKDFLVRRLRAIGSPVQGLRIKAVRGEIEVNGQRHREIILWSNTSPEIVELSVLSEAGCELKIWNVWQAGDVIQAWVGNSGLLTKRIGNVVTLECSDGVGEVDFSDLVVQFEST